MTPDKILQAIGLLTQALALLQEEPVPPAAPEPVKYTIKDLQRVAQQAYSAGKDPVIAEILKEHKVRSLSQVHPDAYSDVITRIKNAL